MRKPFLTFLVILLAAGMSAPSALAQGGIVSGKNGAYKNAERLDTGCWIRSSSAAPRVVARHLGHIELQLDVLHRAFAPTSGLNLHWSFEAAWARDATLRLALFT